MIGSNLAQHIVAPELADRLAFLLSAIVVTPRYGALNQLWLAACPLEQAKTLCGKYIMPYQKVGQPRPDSDDPDLWEKLWAWCETEAKKHV